MEAVKDEIVVNIPIPRVIQGINTDHCLKKYMDEVGMLFAENLKHGIKLCVHSIHFVGADKLIYFVEVDEAQQILNNQLAAQQEMQQRIFSKIDEADCQHDFSDGPVCNKCGSKI